MISTDPSLDSAYPRLVYTGIRKGTTGSIPFESLPVTQGISHYYFLAEKGDAFPRLTRSDQFEASYGSKTLDESSPFFFHPNLGVKTALEEGQIVLSERIIPPNAKKSLFRLSVELCPAEIPVYDRNSDGTIIYLNGEPVVTGTVVGFNVVWHGTLDGYSGPKLEFSRAGAGFTYRSGSLVSSLDPAIKLGEIAGTPQQSYLYAILDAEITDFGSYGDNIGMFIQALTNTTTPTLNQTLLNGAGVYPLLLTLKQLPQNSAVALPIPTSGGDSSIPMILKDNVVDPITGIPVSFEDTFIKAYGDPTGIKRSKGPFGRVHVYKENLSDVLDQLINGGGSVVNGEAFYSADYLNFGGTTDYSLPENQYRLNLFSGIDENDITYFSFNTLNSAGFGGINFEDGQLIYATGGSDGLTYDAAGKPDYLENMKLLDELVRNRLALYGVENSPNMLNIVRYPSTFMWDTGYSKATKEAMMQVTSRRKDMIVALSLHRVAEYLPVSGGPDTWQYVPKLDNDQLAAFQAYLYSKAQLNPESVVDGTGVCRIMIAKGDGASFNPKYPLDTSYLFDIMQKSLQYFGSTNGNWDQLRDYSLSENKNLVLIGSIGEENDITEPMAKNLWDKGSTYPLFRTPDTLCWPMMRMVHRDQTSPLISLEFVTACCTAIKEAHQAWIALVSRNLTPKQFIQESNRDLSARLNPKIRFANKLTVSVDTQITGNDAKRGYSWLTVIEISSPGIPLVNRLQIVGSTQQFEQLAA